MTGIRGIFRKLGVPVAYPQLAQTPRDTTIYAIGDIHGYDDALASIHAQIDSHRARYPNRRSIEVYTGDFVNRGPNSRQVLEMQVQRHDRMRALGVKTIYIQANHEIMFKSMLRVGSQQKLSQLETGFLDNGGIQTLASYGVQLRFTREGGGSGFHKIRHTDLYVDYKSSQAMKEELIEKIPASHLKLLSMGIPIFNAGDYTFVHAAIDPSKNFHPKSQDIAFLTGLDNKARDFVNYQGGIPDKRIIVHGHSVTKEPMVTHNQISLDTGIYKAGHGKLTCVVLQAAKVSVMQAATSLPPYNSQLSAKLWTNNPAPVHT